MDPFGVDEHSVEARKQEVLARAEVYRLERELEKARNAVVNLNRKKYAHAHPGPSNN